MKVWRPTRKHSPKKNRKRRHSDLTVHEVSLDVVNLSEIMAASGFGTTFLGHVFIAANFNPALATVTIYNTTTGAQTLASSVLTVC
jgi:hypothetical protein